MSTTYREGDVNYRDANVPYRGKPTPVPGLNLDRFDDTEIFVADKYGNRYGELPVATISKLTWALNAYGSVQLDFSNLDPTLIKALLLRRDVQIVFSKVTNVDTGNPESWWGTLFSRKGKPGQTSYNAYEVPAWLKLRIVEHATLEYSQWDQLDIAWDLIQQAQTGTGYDLNFSASYSPSGHLRNRMYPRDQHKVFYDLLTEFPGLDNGFDWEFVYDLTVGAGRRIWTPHYPKKGSVKSEPYFEWGRNIIDYEFTEDGFQTRSKLYCTGASENGVKFEANYEDIPTRDKFGAMVSAFADSGQKDVDWLQDRVTKAVNLKKVPQLDLKIKVVDIPAGPTNPAVPVFGSVHTGDTVSVLIDDKANYVSGQFRINTFTWNGDGTYDMTFLNPQASATQ